MKIQTLFVLTLLTASPNLHASILFIDTNNASLEIDRVRTTFKNLIVVPSYVALSPTRRAHIESIVGIQQHNWDQRVLCKQLDRPCPLSDDDYWDASQRLGKLHRDALEGYDFRTFSDELDQVSPVTAKSPITGIIVSGHHSNGYVAGELLAFDLGKLQELFKSRPTLASKVKFLVLLACSSGDATMIRRWASLFPNIRLVIGADGPAPIKTNSNNLAFIQNLSRRLAEVNGQLDDLASAEVQTLFDRLQSPGWSVGQVWLGPKGQELYLSTKSQH